jgi:hypothetical protein
VSEPREPRVPATPGESAFAFGVIRAALACVVAGRKDFRLRITKGQQDRVSGVLLRVGVTKEGHIDAWLEPPRDDMRHGVPYIIDDGLKP